MLDEPRCDREGAGETRCSATRSARAHPLGDPDAARDEPRPLLRDDAGAGSGALAGRRGDPLVDEARRDAVPRPAALREHRPAGRALARDATPWRTSPRQTRAQERGAHALRVARGRRAAVRAPALEALAARRARPRRGGARAGRAGAWAWREDARACRTRASAVALLDALLGRPRARLHAHGGRARRRAPGRARQRSARGRPRRPRHLRAARDHARDADDDRPRRPRAPHAHRPPRDRARARRSPTDATPAEVRRAVADWQEWWFVHATDFVALDGAERAIAMVTETRYGKWLRRAASGQLGVSVDRRRAHRRQAARRARRSRCSCARWRCSCSWLLAVPIGALRRVAAGARVRRREHARCSSCSTRRPTFAVAELLRRATRGHVGERRARALAVAALTVGSRRDALAMAARGDARRRPAGLRPHGARQGPVRRGACAVVHALRNALMPTVTLAGLHLPVAARRRVRRRGGVRAARAWASRRCAPSRRTTPRGSWPWCSRRRWR